MPIIVSVLQAWHVNKKETRHFNAICWNCDNEGCFDNKCPQPKDQMKIASNRKNFSENKQNGG